MTVLPKIAWMFERDWDRDIVTNFLHLLKFKGYIIIDCSEVHFSRNTIFIETGHLDC